MKAICVHSFGEPEVLQLQPVDELLPSSDQVLIKIKAIGVNPVDTYIRSGIYPLKPVLPYTPGFDAAGIVHAVGRDVKHYQVGQRVFLTGSLSGCYAEYALCSEAQIHPLPDQVTFSQGAAVGIPYGAAYYALWFRARAVPGETVLVHGASGAVGIAAIQLARAAGMYVIGSAGSDAGRNLIGELGAHAVLDHTITDYLDDLVDLTCHQGVDVILEMLANVNLDKDLKVLAKHGRVVVIGSRGEVSINPRDMMGRDAAILGMSLFNADAAQKRQIYAAVGAGLQNGTLNPIVGKTFALSQAAEAHRAVLQPGAYGKTVLVVA